MKNMQNINNTQYFRVEKEPELKVGDVLTIVYRALSEKGYNPVNQIVGYIMIHWIIASESDCWIYYVWRSHIYYQS